MVKLGEGGADLDQDCRSATFVEDNCENQNPNFLKDPRLVLLENENRFLKEELKRQKAKTGFYKAKCKSIKTALEKA